MASFFLAFGGVGFAALLGALHGGLLAGLNGFLAGSSYPDRHLEKLAEQLEGGKVLVSVDARGKGCQQEVERIFGQFGAIEAHKALL